MDGATLLLIIFAIIIILLLCWYIGISNSLSRAIVKIDEADSGIDVALTKRYDVLTKMLEITKSYAKHEKETISEVIKLRKGMSMTEKVEANNKMSSEFDRINVLAEAYPELRSSDNFKALQQSVSDVEEHLQAARRLYNSNVSYYNQMLVTFPSSMVATARKLTRREFFEAEEEKRADVKMEF